MNAFIMFGISSEANRLVFAIPPHKYFCGRKLLNNGRIPVAFVVFNIVSYIELHSIRTVRVLRCGWICVPDFPICRKFAHGRMSINFVNPCGVALIWEVVNRYREVKLIDISSVHRQAVHTDLYRNAYVVSSRIVRPYRVSLIVLYRVPLFVYLLPYSESLRTQNLRRCIRENCGCQCCTGSHSSGVRYRNRPCGCAGSRKD